MKRVEFYTYKGKRILLIDFSYLKAADALPVIAEAQQVVEQQPREKRLYAYGSDTVGL